jgi:hypothetical protein
MSQIDLLEGEQVLETFKGSDTTLYLSNARVWASRDDGRTTCLLLRSVDWAGIQHTHYPAFLVLAAFSALFGLFLAANSRHDGGLFVGLGIFGALVLIGCYFGTRLIALSVGAGTGSVAAKIGGGAAALPPAARFIAMVHRTSLAQR